MINYKEISHTGDAWELFARDFLQTRGFYIESPPDRGADGGKDLLISENISGSLNKYKFRWLVSCKHFATSTKSVSEADEPNILERLGSFKADGFIGFYSTVPSSGLNTRLQSLRSNNEIKDYYIFDSKLIENHLITAGYSHLMFRYFPESYNLIKPLHLITEKYEPMHCDACGKDLLENLYIENYKGIIVSSTRQDDKTGQHIIEDVYCACKGECDSKLAKKARASGLITAWVDISDLVIPIEYLRYLVATMNRLRDGDDVYSDAAYAKEKDILIKLAQKVLRFTTEEERERFKELQDLPF